jgi:general secretion pathway protein D
VLIITDASSNIRRLLEIIQLVDVAVASDELQVIQVNYADASELATLLNQIFASGRVRAPAQPGAPPVPPTGPLPIPGAPPAARPGPAGETGGTERPPLIIADKRSNVLLVQARKTEVETIRRLVSQLDINVTGGRRVFIYYAENAKAKDLASTLNAIYGGKETVATSAPTPSTTPRRAGEPPTPPPPPPTTGPGGPIGGTLGATDVALVAGQFRFIADETTNAIIVSAVPRDWADIELTIKQLDKMPRQVLIEVLVAEITLNEETKLGLDWALRSGKFSLGQRALGSVAVTAPADIIAGASTVAGLASGLTAFTFAADQLFAIVNALATEGRVNVISSPHIMTSENKKAVINVSASIPIVTTQQTGLLTAAVGTSQATGSVNQTVEYRDAGVVLTVTPRIGERGTVALDVKQEVNDVGAPEGVTQSPRINKREAETSVVLINNQTLVLGGLITDTRNNTVTGIPLLSRIPIIGWIFGFKDIKRDKRELIILITPRVIGTALDAARITDEMRRVTPELDKAIRNAPRPPTTAAPSAPPVLRPAPEPTSPTPSAPMPPPSSLAPVPPEPPSGVPVIPPAPPR